MKIQKDVRIINSIVNQPDIRSQFDILKTIPDYELMDMREYVELPRYVFLAPDDDWKGFILLDQHAPGMAELHTAMTMFMRGKHAIKFGREVIDHILGPTGLLYVMGWTPVELKAAHWFNRQCGMKEMGERIHPVTNTHCKVFIQANRHLGLTEEHIWSYVF